MNVLQGIARLAIAAPRRIIAVALLVMVGAGIFGIPVTKSLSAGGFQDPASESRQAARLLSEKFGQGDMQMVIAVTSDAGAQSPTAGAVGADLVRQLQASPLCRRRQLGVDRAAARRADTDQQGRQDRADRRRHHRRRERRAKVCQAAGRSAGARPRRAHRAREWRGDDLRPGQQPKRKRPAAYGIHRYPVELRGAGLGVRRPHGGGAATGGGRVRDPGLVGGAARDHIRDRRVDLRTEHHCRNEFGVGHRLHAADRQPVP